MDWWFLLCAHVCKWVCVDLKALGAFHSFPSCSCNFPLRGDLLLARSSLSRLGWPWGIYWSPPTPLCSSSSGVTSMWHSSPSFSLVLRMGLRWNSLGLQVEHLANWTILPTFVLILYSVTKWINYLCDPAVGWWHAILLRLWNGCVKSFRLDV